MSLKLVVPKLEDVPENLREFYKEAEDGTFMLDTDDSDVTKELKTTKKRLGEFRANNTELMRLRDQLQEKLGKFGNADPEMVQEAMQLFAHLEKAEDAELLKAGKFDEVFQRKTKRLVEQHETAVKALQKKLEATEKTTQQQNGVIERFRIREEVLSAVKASGDLLNTAETDVLLRAANLFKLQDGKLVALDGDNPMLNEKGDPYTPDDFAAELIKSSPHLFGAGGGSGGGKDRQPSRGSDGKIRVDANDPVAMGKYADQITKGEAVVINQ